jgi:hypothetical protein
MTIEIVEFRCPTCGRPIGEEGYNLACDTFNKKVDEACSNQIEDIRTKHQAEIEDIKRKQRDEFDFRVSHEVQSQLKQQRMNIETSFNRKLDEAKAELTKKYELELVAKNLELESAKSEDKEEKHRQKMAEYEIQLGRIKGDNEKLVAQVEHLQKTLESVPTELKGTAGEKNLYDILKDAFGQDDLDPKKVGVEMPDVVQTIILRSGEKIEPPIAWDNKTGDSVTQKDIEKAKRYKEICNTDCSIIVTAKGITAKDSEGGKIGLIGRREGILLVHPSIVVGIATLLRNSIIEKSKLRKTSMGRHSKEAKLYDYIASPSRFRRILERVEKKSKLEESLRKEEAYMRKSWSEKKKLIQSWFETDQNDEETINDIIQEEVSKETKEDIEEI